MPPASFVPGGSGVGAAAAGATESVDAMSAAATRERTRRNIRLRYDKQRNRRGVSAVAGRMKRIKNRTAFLLVGLAAMVAAPLAIAAGEGQPADGGARNPSSDARQSYTRETEIIA